MTFRYADRSSKRGALSASAAGRDLLLAHAASRLHCVDGAAAAWPLTVCVSNCTCFHSVAMSPRNISSVVTSARSATRPYVFFIRSFPPDANYHSRNALRLHDRSIPRCFQRLTRRKKHTKNEKRQKYYHLRICACLCCAQMLSKATTFAENLSPSTLVYRFPLSVYISIGLMLYCSGNSVHPCLPVKLTHCVKTAKCRQ